MSELLQDFVNFHSTLKGDEKSESQIFLDRFFQAFQHKGAIEAGAVYEQRVKKGSAKGKTGFADLVWKRPQSKGNGGVLIEMKKRGEDLNKHYSQAFQYWTYLVPDRPRYVLLCNFDEFWIYDFNLQVDTPVDIVPIPELPKRVSAFRFMELGTVIDLNKNPPIFGNNHIGVTASAANILGELYKCLEARLSRSGFEELTAQKFILQCVLAMFAEDRGLLPNDMFVTCIQDCLNGASTYDVIGGLFKEMNCKGTTPSGRYKGVQYFNGGLFADVQAIELDDWELGQLNSVAIYDWSKIRPAIFGSIFESTSNDTERHAKGMHFTSEVDIMKIVVPTITRYWEEKIEAANKIDDLKILQLELQNYRVLDPACGSGNFLYLAYQELKRIEVMLLAKLVSKQKTNSQQVQMGLVTPNQFFGMDINPFAVELARVTLMIARKVAIDHHGLSEPALPLDTLDQNIVCQDALFSSWVKADAIIGNPPFLGAKHMRLNLGDEYIDRIFAKFPDLKDVDFCAYWFRETHRNLAKNTRAGLVGTNSISQGKSRKVSLEYIVNNDGVIHDAVSSQEWSGEAAVHVSIVNWSRQETDHKFLDSKEVSFINSSLKAEIDVTKAERLKANLNQCFQGVIPNGKGFVITESQAKEWIKADPKNQEVLKLFSMGDNLASNPHGKPERWIIDFNDMDIEVASTYKLPFDHLKATIPEERENNRNNALKVNWWKYEGKRLGMRTALATLEFSFAVPEVSKWAIFIPSFSDWLSGNKTKVVASDDFYILGILTSKVHRVWMHAQKATLKADIAYTHNTCFETFPFPQNKTSPLVAKIRAAMQELHQYRTAQMEEKQCGITTLYNKFFHEPASQLYKLHAKLDKLVMQIYGFSDSDDLLEKLLHLNQEIAHPPHVPTCEPLTGEAKDRVLTETRRVLQNMGIIPKD
jgi:hypothetical protein